MAFDHGQPLQPRQLRALAHPLRLAIVAELRTNGSNTATGLAARLDENTGATSYHLRQLAEAGFVEEVPTDGGRRRWWRATEQRHSLMISDYAGRPESAGDLDMYLHEVLNLYMRTGATFLAERDSWGTEWSDAAEMSDIVLRLTPDRLRALNDEVLETIVRHRDAAARCEEGERVDYIVMSFPTRGQVPDLERDETE